MERRKAARYCLHVPVFFTWDSTQAKQAEGFTRDISAAGAYVQCEESVSPVPGDVVVIQLLLPSIASIGPQGMKLNFTGHVLRTGDFQESGFAVLAEWGMELNTGRKNSGQSGELP